MKSNQRWLKLRTTVQLSGALSSSMNRAKPTLKREDSFIKRFSTRQISEQDTVDHTDEEDISKTSTGSPKQRRRKRPRNPISVINPYGNIFFYWLFILTICVLYNLWTAIVREAFPELQTQQQTMWYILDGFTDFTYILDILIQFRTGYLEQGLIVYDSKKLAKHYLYSKYFLLDIATVFPLDLVQLYSGMHPMLRFPRFIKVYRVYMYYYMVESRTLYPNFWRVLNLVHILLLLAHWFGCFYYMLSEIEDFQGEWTYPYKYGDEFRTLTRKYLGSVYWSTLTLTTIGDLPTPESDKQYIFTIISYLIGVFIFATIVGQVGNVITNRNANRLEFERLLDGAKLYMRHHKVPREMQRRVQRWYDYSWSRRGRIQGGGDINSALGLLPEKLRTELALHVNLSTLKKVSIFKECQPEFLHDLVLKMKAYIFTPGDLICRKGEVAREMFIIADGILEVISELGKVLTTMKAGDFFGEIGILNLDGLNKRTADVRSVGYSELFSLSRQDVLSAMKDYPEAQEILQSLGHKRLKEARNTTTSKSVSTSSSKRGSLSPRESSGDELRQSKKIVSRLKSDVSAIRNAFKRSKGMHLTRDLDTMELEPLTPDGRGSIDGTDAPAVRRILKLPRQMTLAAKRAAFRKLGGREAGSGSSDSGGVSRGVLKRMSHVSDESQQGVLGAGLPLLQRLKLLKEKEELEENQDPEHPPRRKSQRGSRSPRSPRSPRDASPMRSERKHSKQEEEEPEVIGAGLPLFARLKLLKANEDREREERERKSEKFVDEKGNIVVKTSDKTETSSSERASSKDGDSRKGSSQTASSETSQIEPFKSRLKSVFQSSTSRKSSPASTSSQDEKINDLNKVSDKKASKESESQSNNSLPIKESLSRKNSSKSPLGRALNRLSKKLNVPESGSSPVTGSPQKDIAPPSPKTEKQQLTVSDCGNKDKEKIQRSESFKKAMYEGLFEGEEDPELNIHISESDTSIDDNKMQKNENDESTNSQEQFNIEVKLSSESGDRKQASSKKLDSSPEDNNSKATNDSLKRKTLSSPPPHSLSDQQNRLSPTSRMISSSLHQQNSPEKAHSSPLSEKKEASSEGVEKLLSKLGAIGTHPEHQTHAEDLVRGVRKILRDKIEDVEVAWEARIDALQQEVAVRDATIQHLTEAIIRMQQPTSAIENGKEERRQSRGSIDTKIIQEESQRRVMIVQLSEHSNPSSDEDECLFMRCNSIESIIHQSPEEVSPVETHAPLKPMRSWPARPQIKRQVSLHHPTRWDSDPTSRRSDVIIDVNSSTDEDLFSYSSDDDHVIFGSISEVANEDDDEEARESLDELPDEFEEDYDSLHTVERGEIRDSQLNSQDWEVQMLANQLAQEQRGVARIIDRDIASGKLHSPLADLHEALATDNLSTLTEMDLSRLEKIVRKEREKLRQYARMYSLDERPVLEDEFSSLYRSRSQLLLSKSSELCRAGPTERRLSTLLKQLTTLPPPEQFLLDRLVYKSSKKHRFSRQQSLCDEQLHSYDVARSRRLKSNTSASMRRSLSMCSPPPDSQPFARQTSVIAEQEDTISESQNDFILPGEEESDNVSAMLVSIQKSVSPDSKSAKEVQPLLKTPR